MSNSKHKSILYIVTQGVLGGAQKYVLDLAVGLSGDYQTAIASGNGQDLEQAAKTSGIPYYRLSRLKRDIHPVEDALAVLEIARLVKKLQPNVVHLNSSKAMIVGSFGAKLGGAKVIISTMHGLVLTEPLPPWKKLLYYLAEKLAAPFQDAVIAVSSADREAALKYRLKPADKIFTIHNGINSNSPNAMSREQARLTLLKHLPSAVQNKKIVFTLADHYPVKGLEVLALAMGRMKDRNDFIIVNAGRPGPATENLERTIKLLGLQNSFFVLALPKPANLLKAGDVFVLPSLKEGLPYALLFAAAAQLPIVASNVGGIPDVVKNESSALLVSPGNESELASAMRRLLDDPVLCQKLAAGAKLASENFGLEKMLAETQKIYGKLLE